MKKLVCAVMAALVLGGFMACKNGGSSKGGAANGEAVEVDSTVLAFDSVVIEDSVIIPHGNGYFKLNCVYPVRGEKVLKDSINAWLVSLISVDNEGNEIKITGADMKEKFKNYADDMLKGYKNNLKMEVDDMAGYSDDPDEMNDVNYEDEINVSVSYEDDEYVTLDLMSYTYRNGAHGMTGTYGVTFCKKDGHICGAELLKNYTKEELQALMLQGLKEYYGEWNSDSNGPATLDELADCTDLSKKELQGNIPMPACLPYLQKDGVHLIYQQYEIACYAAGMPEIVVPRK